MEKKEIVVLEKKLGDGLVNELRAMGPKELEVKLLQLSHHREEIVTTQNNDDELNDAKNLVKELAAPYREQLSQNKLKCRIIHLILKEKELGD